MPPHSVSRPLNGLLNWWFQGANSSSTVVKHSEILEKWGITLFSRNSLLCLVVSALLTLSLVSKQLADPSPEADLLRPKLRITQQHGYPGTGSQTQLAPKWCTPSQCQPSFSCHAQLLSQLTTTTWNKQQTNQPPKKQVRALQAVLFANQKHGSTHKQVSECNYSLLSYQKICIICRIKK